MWKVYIKRKIFIQGVIWFPRPFPWFLVDITLHPKPIYIYIWIIGGYNASAIQACMSFVWGLWQWSTSQSRRLHNKSDNKLPATRALLIYSLYLYLYLSSYYLSFIMSSPFTPIFAARALEVKRSFAAPHLASHTCAICDEEAHPSAHRYNMLMKHIIFAWRQENR